MKSVTVTEIRNIYLTRLLQPCPVCDGNNKLASTIETCPSWHGYFYWFVCDNCGFAHEVQSMYGPSNSNPFEIAVKVQRQKPAKPPRRKGRLRGRRNHVDCRGRRGRRSRRRPQAVNSSPDAIAQLTKLVLAPLTAARQPKGYEAVFNPFGRTGPGDSF